MKQLLCLSLLVAALSLPATARADSWADYEDFSKDFYQLDKAMKGPISCHIRSSALDEVMDKIPQVGEAIADQVDSFRVTVKSDGSIIFVTPRIKIPDGPYDASEELMDNLTKVIAREEKGTWGLLKDMMSPKKDEIRDISMTHKDGKTLIAATVQDMDGSWFKSEVAHADDMDVAKEVHGKDTLEAEVHFMKLDGKYAMQTESSKYSGDSDVKDANLTVKYQKVGSVWFPQRLIDDVHYGPKLTPGHVELTFTDCTGP